MCCAPDFINYPSPIGHDGKHTQVFLPLMIEIALFAAAHLPSASLSKCEFLCISAITNFHNGLKTWHPLAWTLLFTDNEIPQGNMRHFRER